MLVTETNQTSLKGGILKMKTRVLVKSNSKDIFGIYDTELDTVLDDAGNTLAFDGLYVVKNNNISCTTDKQEIKDHLQTFKIISN